jgi:carboxymethylenebutenolidase
MGQMITLQVGSSRMQAYASTPDGIRHRPGVMVSPHQYGLSKFTCGFVDSLAGIGCVAIAIDHFHHSRPEEDMEAKKRILRDEWILEDFAAAISYLREHPHVDEDKLVVTGHCMGGRAAFMAASEFPMLKGAIIHYSGGMFVARGNAGPTPFERLNRIRCPIIGFFGELDKNPSPEDVAKIDVELTRVGVPHSFHSYPGAVHGFCDATLPKQYNEEGAKDSWARTVEFLSRQVGLAGPSPVLTH